MDAPHTCTVGCTIRGLHLEACDLTCTGCFPAAATHGLLCDRCRAALGGALTLAPPLVRHLRDSRVPGSAHPTAGKIRHTKGDAPAPVNLPVVDAADLIYALLDAFVANVVDTTPLNGPDRPAAWRTSASHGDVVGLRSWATGEEAAVLAGWLHTHIDQITGLPWIGEVFTRPDRTLGTRGDLVSVVHQASRAWPLEDHPVRLDTPCPDCEQVYLVWYPPQYEGLPVTIACTRPECGAQILEEELPAATRLAITRHQQREADALAAALQGATA